MSKNINEYKSEMQNVKFSPDFVSKTIASLNEIKTDVTETLTPSRSSPLYEMKTDVTQTLTPRQSDPRFSIIRNVSLALVACFLCVFTVTLVMRQDNTAENLQTVEIPPVTAVIQETSPTMIDEIGEFTPFAALPSLTENDPLPEPDITEAETTAAPAAEGTTVAESATVVVTEAETTVVTEAETAAVTEATTTAVTEAATTAATEAETAAATEAAITRASTENETAEDDSAQEGDAEGDTADSGFIESYTSSVDESAVDEDAEESEIITADEEVLTGNELMIDNSLSFDSFTAYEMMSIENYNALLRYKDNTAIFLNSNQTTALAGNAALIINETLEKNSIVFVNSAELEFHLSITDKTNVKYVIYLFTDSLAIAVYDKNGSYTLSAITLKSADYNKLFAEMYTDLFSEAEYELYLARESGK